jgi:thiamine biosynthesis lipoprotein
LLKISETIKSEILDFQNKYSRFDKNSLLNELNYEKMVSYDDDLWQMIYLGMDFQKNSQDIFNLFIKKKLEEKGYGQKLLRKDNFVEIDNSKPKVFSEDNKIILNTNEHIDLGGIGKGFLIDKLSKILLGLDINFFIINGGGDLYATSNFEKPVTVHLEHPQLPKIFVGEVELFNQSLCASSTYKRKWKKDDKTESHLVSGGEFRDTASFVILSNATTADVLVTIICLEKDLQNLENLSLKYKADFLVLEGESVKYASPNFTSALYK